MAVPPLVQPQGMKEVRRDADAADNRETIETCKNGTLRKLEALVLKNRQGETGGVFLEYNTLFNTIADKGRMPRRGEPDISAFTSKF